VLQPEVKESVIINACWSIFNLLLLTVALLVAFEQPQLRRTHRLSRQLQAIVQSAHRSTMTGKTLDVSESGAKILLENWSNFPDIIDLELVGDFGARVFLNGKVIRVEPIDENQIVLVVDFIDLTAVQYDALCLVIYSDVKEWYSQNNQHIDRPFASLGFLLTGLLRALREPKPADRLVRRKQIQASAQLYWEGHFYPATAIEMNSRSLRLEINARSTPNLDLMRQTHPPVGLLLSQFQDDAQPNRLIAQVEVVEMPVLSFSTTEASGRSEQAIDTVAVELIFPENLDLQQGNKIKQLLKTLK
jgi:cellulose synthase (UDP-forming)